MQMFHFVMATLFAHQLYAQIKSDRKWNAKFAEINAKVPRNYVITGYFLKIFAASMAAWQLTLTIKGD